MNPTTKAHAQIITPNRMETETLRAQARRNSSSSSKVEELRALLSPKKCSNRNSIHNRTCSDPRIDTRLLISGNRSSGRLRMQWIEQRKPKSIANTGHNGDNKSRKDSYHQIHNRSGKNISTENMKLSLATASMGTYSGWPTPVLPKLALNESGFALTQSELGWMLTSNAPGFMAGSILTRFISDALGRRTAIIASALPMILGTVMVLSAVNTIMLCATKFLWGFGTGMIANVATIYLVEIGDKDLRASLLMITRFTFNFGVLIVMSVGPFLSYAALNWSLLVLPLCFFVSALWIPESPYYHLKEGRVDRARKELSRLCGKSGDALESHLQELQADVRKETRKSSSVRELFSGKQYRRAIIIAAGLKVTQILTGTVTIQQYLGLIVKNANMSMEYSTALIVFAAVRFVVSLMSSFFVDRVGRVPLLQYSYLGTGVTLVTVGFYFYHSDSLEVMLRVVGSYVAFVCITLANVISTVGFISITMVITAEVFPLNVKDVAMTSLNIFGGCLGMVVTKAYDGIKSVWGLYGVFWVFATVAFFGALFSKLVVLETRGKSLKEIQAMLQRELYDETDDVHVAKDLIPKTDNIENDTIDLKTVDTKL